MRRLTKLIRSFVLDGLMKLDYPRDRNCICTRGCSLLHSMALERQITAPCDCGFSAAEPRPPVSHCGKPPLLDDGTTRYRYTRNTAEVALWGKEIKTSLSSDCEVTVIFHIHHTDVILPEIPSFCIDV